MPQNTMEEMMNEARAKVVTALRETNREGIENLLKKMDEIGFWAAPCSSCRHLAREGGLALHSLNVMQAALKLCDALLPKLDNTLRNSVVLCALCHDIGKCGAYGKPFYVPNYLKSGKLSDAKPYQRNDALMAVPHAVRSVEIISSCMPITQDEEWAIMTHGGMYDEMKLVIADHETPLSLILHWADMWATRVSESGDIADWYTAWRNDTNTIVNPAGNNVAKQ